MKFDANTLSLISFMVILLSKYSKQEKPEDCVVGVQYWSPSILDGEGTCAKCPRHLRNCDAQPIVDRTNCQRSCAKPKPPSTKKLSTTKWPPTSTAYVTSPPPKVISLLSGSQSGVHHNEVNENEKRPEVDGDYDGMNKIALIVILVVFGVTIPPLVVLLVVAICKRLKPQSAVPSLPSEVIPLQPIEGNQATSSPSDEQLQQPAPQPSDEQPTQATMSTRVDGIQEEDQDIEQSNHTQYLSTLNLREHFT